MLRVRERKQENPWAFGSRHWVVGAAVYGVGKGQRETCLDARDSRVRFGHVSFAVLISPGTLHKVVVMPRGARTGAGEAGGVRSELKEQGVAAVMNWLIRTEAVIGSGNLREW